MKKNVKHPTRLKPQTRFVSDTPTTVCHVPSLGKHHIIVMIIVYTHLLADHMGSFYGVVPPTDPAPDDMLISTMAGTHVVSII